MNLIRTTKTARAKATATVRNVLAATILCCAAVSANAVTEPRVDQAIRAISNAIDGLFRLQNQTIQAVREIEDENRRLRFELEQLRIEIQSHNIRHPS